MSRSQIQCMLPYKLRRELRAVLRGTSPADTIRKLGHVRAAIRRDGELACISGLCEAADGAYAAALDAGLDQGVSLARMRVKAAEAATLLTGLLEDRKITAGHYEQGQHG